MDEDEKIEHISRILEKYGLEPDTYSYGFYRAPAVRLYSKYLEGTLYEAETFLEEE